MPTPNGPVGPPLCDLHLDTVLEIQGGADLGRGHPAGHVDIARLRRGGAGLVVFACFVPNVLPTGRAFREASTLLDLVDRTCADFPGDLVKVTSAAEAGAAMAGGRIGVLPAVENGLAIESDLGHLEQLRRRGVRYLTLTHARHLEWAASSDEPWSGNHGLTAFGREVVRAMEGLGMIVDVSHVHPTTFWDVVRVARKPIIASHSCAAALCPVSRNLTDEQVGAIADTGGMVGVNFFPGFLDPDYFAGDASALERLWAESQRIEAEFADDPVRRVAESHRTAAAARAARGPVRADLDLLIAHIRHLVERVGDEHVGLGSDFDGVFELPRDLPDCSAYPLLLDRLRRCGMSERSVQRIAGENFLRVLRAHDT
jgi:membrane dipeptidase